MGFFSSHKDSKGKIVSKEKSGHIKHDRFSNFGKGQHDHDHDFTDYNIETGQYKEGSVGKNRDK